MRRSTFVGLVVLLGGCAKDAAAPGITGGLGPPTTVAAPPRDITALFQTDSLSYTLNDNLWGWDLPIDVQFTNTTATTVYFVNCNDQTALHLERSVDGQWRPVWSPILPLCLGPPITVAPSEVRSLRVWVNAGYPDNNVAPKFAGSDIAGVYRIVWHQALSTYDAKRTPFGDTLAFEYRVSNRFALNYRPR
jgi:hypothetical protein